VKSHRQRGFSLIEVGIAVGVTGVGALIAAQMYSQLYTAKAAGEVLSDLQMVKTQISLMISDRVKCNAVFGYNGGPTALWWAPQSLTSFGTAAGGGSVQFVGTPSATQNIVNLYNPNPNAKSVFMVGSNPGKNQNHLGINSQAQITRIQVIPVLQTNAMDQRTATLNYVNLVAQLMLTATLKTPMFGSSTLQDFLTVSFKVDPSNGRIVDCAYQKADASEPIAVPPTCAKNKSVMFKTLTSTWECM